MRRLAAQLSACLILVALMLPGTVRSQEAGDLDALRQKALELVNESRRNQGLEPLTLGPALNEAAQEHAEDMLERDYYAHVSPEGDTVRDRFLEAGGNKSQVVAENIARCQGCSGPLRIGRVEALHEGWMDSPEHRENILRRGLARFGFGIVVGDEQTLYAVQTFAGPGTSRDLQPQEEAVAIGPQRQNEMAVQRLNRFRRDENAPALQADSALMEAASNLLPEGGLDSLDTDRLGNLMQALPEDARNEWRSLAVLMGSCSGCGSAPNAADIRFFLEQWRGDPQQRERLLSRDFTHAGFRLRADGEGMKSAVLVLGQHR